MRRVMVGAVFVLGTSGCMGPALSRTVAPLRNTRAVAAAYVCPPEALLLTESAGRRRLTVASQDWTTSNGWRAADGYHFVIFERTADARVAREYVLPLDGTSDAELREYNRRLGASFAVEADTGDVWRVRGKPSSRATCPAASAGRDVQAGIR